MTNTNTYTMNENAALKGWIANLGKYNEGELVGRWISFPISNDELDAVYSEIGIGSVDYFGNPYEEIAFFDYDNEISGLELGEYESIDNLNEIAESWESLEEYERETVAAILEAGLESDLHSAIDNIDHYTLLSDIYNDYDLGYYFAVDCGALDIPDGLINYIDFEAYGRDCSFDGCYTSAGFIY